MPEHHVQYNTCFWALVKSGKSRAEANQALQVRPRRACDGHWVLGLHPQKLWTCRACCTACMAVSIKALRDS